MQQAILKTIILLLTLVLCSCEKEAGVGGTARIHGQLRLLQYNDDFSLLIDSSYAQDEKICILYGDDLAIQDDVDTNPNGYFEFDYLYEGEYTMLYFSELVDGVAGIDDAIQVTIDLTKGEDLDLGTLDMCTTLDVDEGHMTISGNVYEVSLKYNGVPEDTIIATEKEVYLRYSTHQYYDERIRTQEDGSFYFENLIPGDYTIYVFSEDVAGSDQSVPISREVTVANDYGQYHLDDFYIFNL